MDYVTEFIKPAQLEGFYRIDGWVAGDIIAEIENSEDVLLAEFLGYLAYIDLGFEVPQVEYKTMDPYWHFMQ